MTAPDSRDSVERVVAEMRSYRMLGEFPLAEAQDWADRLQALARGPQQAGGEDVLCHRLHMADNNQRKS